jgi:uncharacterized membrane protein YkoI
MKNPVIARLISVCRVFGFAILLPFVFSEFCSAGAERSAVQLSELPPAAQKCIQTQLSGAQLGEITKSIEGEEVSYDVKMTTKGKTRSFTVSEDGELLAFQLLLPETPHAVQQAIRAHVGKQALDDIFKHTQDSEVTYEVEMTKAGKTRTFTLASDGKLLEMQVFLHEIPAVIQKAIRKEMHGGRCEEIQKITEDGEVNYDVEITRNGKSHSLTFDSKGAIVYQAEAIQLSETPEPVQRTLKAQLTGAKLVSLEKATEDGDMTYEVELVKAGRRQTLSVKPDGQILPPEAE